MLRYLPEPVRPGVLVGRIGLAGPDMDLPRDRLVDDGLNVRSIKQTPGIQNLDSAPYFSELAPIAPIAEQTAIARFLDHADRNIQRCIHLNEQAIELLLEYRTRVISDVVTGKIDVSRGSG